MRLFIPLALTFAFLVYAAYLAFFKKELAKNLKTIIYPGAFFVAVWGIMYAFLLN